MLLPAAATATTASAAAAFELPRLGRRTVVRGRAIVRYTDGKAYIAEHANPGYDPIISTWYWEPYACDNGPGTPVGNFVVTEAQFNQMFPNRNPSTRTAASPPRSAPTPASPTPAATR